MLEKKKFLILTYFMLFFNCLTFTAGALAAFHRGAPGVENQAALVIIPAMLVPLAWVVSAGLAGVLAVFGCFLKSVSFIAPAEVFKMSGRGGFAVVLRVGYLALTAGLMGFAALLMSPFYVISAVYAASGGALMVLIFALVRAAVRG